MLKKGLVLRGISSFYYVLIDDKVLECRASKKLKLNKKYISMGDDVVIDFEKKYIIEVLERQNILIRPKVSNVDYGALVFSAKEPKMSYTLLDRMLIPMELNAIDSMIIVTKTDLVSKQELEDLKMIMSYYIKIGYDVFYPNESESYRDFLSLINSKRVVFTGQTGVGKSTLINKICPNLNIETQEISKALGRGKHTTREVTFFAYENGYIIDTPGFSSLDVPLTDVLVRDSYVDFVNASKNCKFSTCFHIEEPNCEIKNLFNNDSILKSRYEGYKKLIKTVRENK